MQDLSFTKYLDQSSTDLILYCCLRREIKNAELVVRKAGGEFEVECLKVKMTNVIIASVSADAYGTVAEKVVLRFEEVQVEYTPQAEDGSPKSPTMMRFDIPKNSPL